MPFLWRTRGSRIFPALRPRNSLPTKFWDATLLGWREAGALPDRLLAYLPAAIWALVIAYLAGASDLPGLPAIRHLDKAAHFGAYFILGCLLGYGWLMAGRRPGRIWLLAFALVLGVSDEFRQSRLPDRTADVGDWAADAVGAISGLFLVTSFRRERRTMSYRDQHAE